MPGGALGIWATAANTQAKIFVLRKNETDSGKAQAVKEMAGQKGDRLWRNGRWGRGSAGGPAAGVCCSLEPAAGAGPVEKVTAALKASKQAVSRS